MGSLSPWHWLIIAVVVVILFGSKKLPDAARSVGKSLRIFKSEVRELQNDGKPQPAATTNPATPVESARADNPAPAAPEQTHTDARPA